MSLKQKELIEGCQSIQSCVVPASGSLSQQCVPGPQEKTLLLPGEGCVGRQPFSQGPYPSSSTRQSCVGSGMRGQDEDNSRVLQVLHVHTSLELEPSCQGSSPAVASHRSICKVHTQRSLSGPPTQHTLDHSHPCLVLINSINEALVSYGT